MIALVYKPRKGRLQVNIPWMGYSAREWLKDIGVVRAEWIYDGRYWAVPRSKYEVVVAALAAKFDMVHVTVDGHSKQKCDTRCRDARGTDCVCSCAGAHHGVPFRGLGWVLVGDTTLISTEVTRSIYEVRAS